MGRVKKIIERGLVIDKVLELITETGYEGFSTRGLAKRLGVSVMTLYNYFDNRDAIVRAAIVAGRARFIRDIATDIGGRGEGTGGLDVYRQLMESLLAYALAKPRLYAFLFGVAVPLLERGEAESNGYHELLSSLLVVHIGDRARAESFDRAAFLYQLIMHRLIIALLEGSMGITPERCRLLAAEAFHLLLEPYAADLRGAPSFKELVSSEMVASRIALLGGSDKA